MATPRLATAGFRLADHPPAVKDKEVEAVVKWIRLVFDTQVQRLNSPSEVRFEVLHTPPEKPREAQLVYADGTNWNPGDGEGLYVFDGSVWRSFATGAGIIRATEDEVLIGTDTVKLVTPDTLAALWKSIGPVTNAATFSLGEGGYFSVSAGAPATITSITFAVAGNGRQAWMRWGTSAAGSILVHSATLDLPGQANITIRDGDMALFMQISSTLMRCIAYTRRDGMPLLGSPIFTGTVTGNQFITQKFIMADDTAAFYTTGPNGGNSELWSINEFGGGALGTNQGRPHGLFRSRTGDPNCQPVAMEADTNVLFGQGALIPAGTTLTDTKFNIYCAATGVGATSGLYLENRTGGTRTVNITRLG